MNEEEKMTNQPDDNGATLEQLGEGFANIAREEAQGCASDIMKKIKWFFIIVGAIAVLFLGFLAVTDSSDTFINSIDSIVSGEAAYIDMVKNCYVEALGTTYGKALSGAQNAKWSYFQTEDGRQIVELNVRNSTDTACIQFELTKQGADSYWIEPVYSDVNGMPIEPLVFFAALMS